MLACQKFARNFVQMRLGGEFWADDVTYIRPITGKRKEDINMFMKFENNIKSFTLRVNNGDM